MIKNKKPLSNKEINEIFNRFSKDNPYPLSELDYINPYTLLIAIILSAQSTDKGVNKATPALFDVVKTPESMVILGEVKLKEYIKSIGLYNNKARNIIAMSNILIEKFNSIIPNTIQELQTLPGVGRKSANLILNIVFKKPTIPVDTHIFRVSNRIGLCNTKNPTSTEICLNSLIPKKYKIKAHHWLVLHGRYICKARKPECYDCIINDICRYELKTIL